MARLTDKQKKKIIADRVNGMSIRNLTAKYEVSATTIHRTLKSDPEIAAKCQQKKEENTAAILEYMESQRDDVCDFLCLAMEQLKNPEKLEKAQLQQIATTMAIVIDKYTAVKGEEKSGRIIIVDDF